MANLPVVPLDIPLIEADELRRWFESGRPLNVLDIRPAAERAEWSIPGSMHVDAYADLRAGDPAALASAHLDPGVPVVTVCARGRTSLLAAERLRERGYDVRSLAGGMKGWSLAWNSAEVAGPPGGAQVLQLRRTGKGCLSYLAASGAEAIVVDPSLDPEVYADQARLRGWTIRRVFETHIHADHVSRARMLADHSGAVLHVPEQTRGRFPHEPVRDGDSFAIGASTLRAIRTPGHTQESTCYVLDDWALFSGDTLFLDSIGRPDLEAGSDRARVFAHDLHRSLRRLVALSGELTVLPAHTSRPVAFDRRPLEAKLGEVRDRIALLHVGEDEFVEMVLSRIPPTPPNHGRILGYNESGTFPEGDVADLEAGANRCAVA